MFRKQNLVTLAILLFGKMLIAQDTKLSSVSMENFQLSVSLNATGTPLYSVLYKNKTVIASSELGFVLADGKNLHSDFVLTASEKNRQMKHGNRFGVNKKIFVTIISN